MSLFLRMGAPMADRDIEQDSLFKEIDEDLRQQKYAILWKKYNKFIIGVAITLVIAVAAIKGWEAYDLYRKSAESSLLTSAHKLINGANPAKAIPILDRLANEGSDGYSVLAKFNKAAILSKSGDKKGASASYLSIAEDNNIEKIFRDMALIMSAQLGLENMDSVIFIDKLSKLIDGKNAWRHSAKELSALFTLKSGDRPKSLKLYEELSDDATAPSSIRSRAAEMIAILGTNNW